MNIIESNESSFSKKFLSFLFNLHIYHLTFGKFIENDYFIFCLIKIIQLYYYILISKLLQWRRNHHIILYQENIGCEP